MKKVFDSNEVAHIWANQEQNEGRNSGGNFYFKGRTIFSYGEHFPIATIEGQNVLFTKRTYSNTTAKHLSKVRGAISHKNIIYCYDVPYRLYNNDPLPSISFISTHESNFKHWKDNIKMYFSQLGNPKNRNIQDRINSINANIEELNKYVGFFKLKIKDKELTNLLKIAGSDNFIAEARQAKEKQDKAQTSMLNKATKAYSVYIDLWRKYDNDAIQNLDAKTKELCRYYANNSDSYTRLRIDENENRIETSKGVKIPVAIAHKAYLTLNGCFNTNCKDLSIPVMDYEITESTKQFIIAGCHTIPNEDIKYIAQRLNW